MTERDHSSTVFVGSVVLLALGIRLLVVAGASAPLNDGGLFHAFVQQLLDSRLALPSFSTYNAASIPFVYPPLGFYFLALLHLLMGISLISLFQYVPAVISLAAIPAFYVLARQILGSSQQAALAALVFALLPRAFDWLIMGGGLTRALGLLFSLLVLIQAHRLFAMRDRGAIVPAIVFGGLLVLSHPQAVIHTIISALLLLLWHDRSTRGFRDALLVAIGIVAVTAPWWITVLTRHGIAPFIAASAAAQADSYGLAARVLALFRFDFTNEPNLRLLGVLGLLGLAASVARGRYLLPIWLISLQLVEPRGAALFMMIPLAMAAAYFLGSIILPAVSGNDPGRESAPAPTTHGQLPWLVEALRAKHVGLALGFLAAYGSLSAYSWGMRIAVENTLTPSDLRAFTWIRNNTDPSENFALVTGAPPLRDAVSDWFPSLTGRRSAATVFGLEWVPGVDFGARLDAHRSLQACAREGVDCLEAWTAESGEPIDYVYLRVENMTGQTALHAYLAASASYREAYVDGDLVIYARR